MKDNDQLLSSLYLLLADELADIKDDVSNFRKRNNCGSGILHVMTHQPATDAMQNAGWLIERIIFLEGSFMVSKLDDHDTSNMLNKIHQMQEGHLEWFGMNLFN